MEGNLRFGIDWASLIVGSKFIVFALFYFLFEGNFPSTSLRGGLYLEGRFNGGFFALQVWGGLYLGGLIHGGAYFWNFTVIFHVDIFFVFPHPSPRPLHFSNGPSLKLSSESIQFSRGIFSILILEITLLRLICSNPGLIHLRKGF